MENRCPAVVAVVDHLVVDTAVAAVVDSFADYILDCHNYILDCHIGHTRE